MAETSFITVFLPVMVALRLQVLCVYNPSPNSGSGCSVCFISCCTISSVAQCLCWESEGQGRGRALVWWGNAARLHDSAFYLAKAITKTQLSPFCAQSLSCSLTRSAVWNMLIPQAGLFGASNSHKNIICCCPLSLAQLGALGCSCFPWCLALFLSLLPVTCAKGPLPSNALLHRSLGRACVQVRCYFWGDISVQLLIVSRGVPSCCLALTSLIPSILISNYTTDFNKTMNIKNYNNAIFPNNITPKHNFWRCNIFQYFKTPPNINLIIRMYFC